MNHKLKIALMVPTLTGGGAERVIVNLSNYYARCGHKVWLLTTRKGEYFKSVSPQVDLRILPSFNHFSLNLLYLIPFLILNRPHVLLTTLETANIFGPLAVKLALVKTKIIVREASTLDRFKQKKPTPENKKALNRMKFSYSLAHGLIANSQQTADDLKSFGILRNRPYKVIPNPVYSDSFHTMAEDQTKHPWVGSRTPYILSAGRLHELKDQKNLIKAVSILRKKHEIKLIILGTGPEESNLKKYSEELGISDSVSLPGFVQNPYPFYKNAKLFCLSSKWEGFGNVLIEALAFGLPVVSTDCPGGPRWILNEGRFGHLVPVGDSSLLAQALENVLENPEKFKSRDQRARAMEYSVEKIGNKYLSFIRSVIQQ